MSHENPVQKIQNTKEIIKSPEELSVELLSKIKILDITIFPNKPLSIHLDTNTESGAEASHHFDDNDSNNTNEHFYTVWKKGIENNQLIDKINPEKELLRIALHEVRHRVQHDLNIKMLDINNLKQFIVENPKTPLEKYFSSDDYQKFLEYITTTNKSENDFDAMVVEDIAIKLLKGNYSDKNIEKIAKDIIQQSSEIILKKIKEENE